MAVNGAVLVWKCLQVLEPLAAGRLSNSSSSSSNGRKDLGAMRINRNGAHGGAVGGRGWRGPGPRARVRGAAGSVVARLVVRGCVRVWRGWWKTAL